MVKKCLTCKKEFEPRSKSHRFCSSKCRNDFHNNKHRFTSKYDKNGRSYYYKRSKKHITNSNESVGLSGDELLVNAIEQSCPDNNTIVDSSSNDTVSTDIVETNSFFVKFVRFIQNLFKH